MAIDVNIFISNKEDEIQKALAILEVSSDLEEIKRLSTKNNISTHLIEDCTIIHKKFENGKIKLSNYEKINVNNYKSYSTRDQISSKQ